MLQGKGVCCSKVKCKLIISLDMWWGKSCKGPTPQADLKSFHPVVHMRVLENTVPSLG